MKYDKSVELGYSGNEIRQVLAANDREGYLGFSRNVQIKLLPLQAKINLKQGHMKI